LQEKLIIFQGKWFFFEDKFVILEVKPTSGGRKLGGLAEKFQRSRLSGVKTP